MTNNTTYTEQAFEAFHFHQYFRYIVQLIYQLFYFYIYSFSTLSILLCHMIYHTRTNNYSRILNTFFITYSFVN